MAELPRAVAWRGGLARPSVGRLLRRLGVRYRRGRRAVHSPDPLYDAKLAWVAAARDMAAAGPGQYAFLYQDELTYHRRPTVARGYAPAGDDAPRADQGHRGDRTRRVIGALDAVTGRLFCWQRSHADAATLARFYGAVAAAYPRAAAIFLAQDNWPVHAHPTIAAATAPTPIHVLWLPTYAPWTNPIEKVWRKLYEDVRHLHGYIDDWDGLVAAVTRWPERYAGPSPELLRYVGLDPG